MNNILYIYIFIYIYRRSCIEVKNDLASRGYKQEIMVNKQKKRQKVVEGNVRS